MFSIKKIVYVFTAQHYMCGLRHFLHILYLKNIKFVYILTTSYLSKLTIQMFKFPFFINTNFILFVIEYICIYE